MKVKAGRNEYIPNKFSKIIDNGACCQYTSGYNRDRMARTLFKKLLKEEEIYLYEENQSVKTYMFSLNGTNLLKKYEVIATTYIMANCGANAMARAKEEIRKQNLAIKIVEV